MADRNWKSREIVERLVIEGKLVLETPTSLGNGDTEGLTDVPLFLDPLKGEALLPGTSVAGALRNHLRECLFNYGRSEGEVYKDEKGQRLKAKDLDGKESDTPLPIVTQLFGSLEDDGEQSPLIIDDARGAKPTTELRDSVRIDGRTRTALINEKGKGQKFDVELLEAGSTFDLRLELLVSERQDKRELLRALATGLRGFEQRQIFLGARKRRGYGECHVAGWTVKRYDLRTQEGLLGWLQNGAKKDAGVNEAPILQAINEAHQGCNFEIQEDEITDNDNRTFFKVTAQFALESSLLIRSGSLLLGANDKAQPDTTHLRSKRAGKGSVPIVSGTSLAGVLRHRALRIAKTIANEAKQKEAEERIEQMFGVDMEELKERNKKRREDNKTGENDPDEKPFASRLEVAEAEITTDNPLVQTRVRIDRFTGGAYEGALFDAAPIFAKNKQQAVNLTLKLRSPQDSEIGMVILLLKDLWTSDLAIGGESSIGRGRLQGLGATLDCHKGTDSWRVEFRSEADTPERVQFTAEDLPTKTEKKTVTEFLNDFVAALNEQLG